jgi:hypothetical protein
MSEDKTQWTPMQVLLRDVVDRLNELGRTPEGIVPLFHICETGAPINKFRVWIEQDGKMIAAKNQALPEHAQLSETEIEYARCALVVELMQGGIVHYKNTHPDNLAPTSSKTSELLALEDIRSSLNELVRLHKI